MDFDHIQANWKKASTGNKSQRELWMMTQINQQPQIRRLKIKLIIEAMAIGVFLIAFYDGFDGQEKPLWATIFLIAAAAIYIMVRTRGVLLLRNPIKGENLKISLVRFKRDLLQMATISLLSSCLFGAAFITFFTSAIDLTREKYIVLIGMIVFLLLLVYLSSRNWLRKIKTIQRTLGEFEASRGEE